MHKKHLHVIYDVEQQEVVNEGFISQLASDRIKDWLLNSPDISASIAPFSVRQLDARLGYGEEELVNDQDSLNEFAFVRFVSHLEYAGQRYGYDFFMCRPPKWNQVGSLSVGEETFHIYFGTQDWQILTDEDTIDEAGSDATIAIVKQEDAS